MTAIQNAGLGEFRIRKAKTDEKLKKLCSIRYRYQTASQFCNFVKPPTSLASTALSTPPLVERMTELKQGKKVALVDQCVSFK